MRAISHHPNLEVVAEADNGRTALEEIRRLEPEVALVLVLDRSWSMAGTSMDLCKAAAQAAVDVMTDEQALGVLTFNDQFAWDIPVRTVGGSRDEIRRKIAAIEPGGHTLIFPAVEQAYLALRNAKARARHVLLLSDGYLANGAEPWKLPDVDALPDISVPFATEPNHGDEYWPYLRDPETLARPWALPGTPGLEHRIGGLEKADVTGSISYDPENHDLMTRLRAAKVAGIANDIPLLEVDDPDGADTLVLGWGSTYGPIAAAVRRVRRGGRKVAQAHLHYLNPFPRNTGEVLRSYDKVLVPEMNLGQLLKLVRAEFLVDAVGYNRVRGLPFKAAELEEAIVGVVES